MKFNRMLCIVIAAFLLTGAACLAEEYVWLNQNFENNNHDGIKFSPNSNRLELACEGENTYAELVLSNRGNSHIDIILADCEESIVIGTKICIAKKSGMSESGESIALKGSMFSISDSMTGSAQDLIYVRNGNITNCKTMNEGQWYKVDVVVNLENQTYSAYVDGKVLNGANEQKLSGKFGEISSIRFLFDGMGTVYMDDFVIYSGTQIKEISGSAVLHSIYKTDAYVKRKLDGINAIHMTGNAYSDGEKKKTKYPPELLDGELYISGADFAEFVGIGYTADKNRICFDNGAVLCTDCRKMEIGGNTYKISGRARFSDGVLMLPVNDFLKHCDTKFAEYDGNVLLISNEERAFSAREREEISLYLTNPRLTAEELREKFVGVHPYIAVSDFDEIKKEISENALKSEWYAKLKSRADDLLCEAVYDYGSDLYTKACGAMDRLDLLSFIYATTGDDAYYERACAELDAICALDGWACETHFLTTAEFMTGLALAYDRFYYRLDLQRKQAIKDAIVKLGLEPAHSAYYGSFVGNASWCSVHSNWGSVCNGAVIIAALSVADEENGDFCFDLVRNALRGFEYAVYAASPDGAWGEGVGYWAYFLDYTARTAKVLETALKTDMDIFSQQGMDKIGYFVRSLSNGGRNNNFHDAGELQQISSAAMFLIADKCDDAELNSLRLGEMEAYGIAPSVDDILYYNGKASDGYTLPRDVYYRGAEIVAARGGDDSFLSFHGGRNDGTHAHYDAGTFVYDKHGYRWAMDLGIDSNTYNDSDENRYKFYRVRTEGHNAVVINPTSGAGQSLDGEARTVEYQTSADEMLAITDLSEFYSDSTESVKRGYFMRDGRDRVIIRDEITGLTRDNSEIYWFMHTLADGEVVGGDTVILRRGTKALRVKFSSNVDFELSFVPAVPLDTSPEPIRQADDSGRNKICCRIVADGDVYINAEISDYDSNYTTFDKALSDWRLENADSGLWLERQNGDVVAGTEYDGENLMLSVACYSDNILEEVRLKNAEDMSVTIPYEAGKLYRAMLWDENLRPLTEAAELGTK